MEFGAVIFKRIIALVTSEIKFRLTTIDNVVVLQLYENCRACFVLGWVEGNASVSVSTLLFGRKLDSDSESTSNDISQQWGVRWGHDANEQQMGLLLMIQYSGHRNSK